MRVLAFGFFLSFFAIGFPIISWALDIRKVDINGDGFKEESVFYNGKEVVRALIDNDRDGRVDGVIYYKNGNRDHAEGDLNGDGRADAWVSYYFTGIPWKVAEDRDHDGRPDYWFYLKGGKIYRWEQDRDGDGKADIRTTYEIDGAGTKTRTLVQQSYDDDHDGLFESLSKVTIAKKEANAPRSLAEALLR